MSEITAEGPIIKGRMQDTNKMATERIPQPSGLGQVWERIKHLRGVKEAEDQKAASVALPIEGVSETQGSARRIPRRAVVAGGAAIAGGLAAAAILGTRNGEKTQEIPVSSWTIGEVSADQTSFTGLRDIVSTFPNSEKSDSPEQTLRSEMLELLDRTTGAEASIKKFVDAYLDFKDSDGTPILRKLVKQRLLNIDLKPLLEGQSRYKSEAELLDDQFFFMEHNRYLNLDRANFSKGLAQIKGTGVGGIDALGQIKAMIDKSILIPALKRDQTYDLEAADLKGRVVFTTDALKAGLSKNGKTLQEDQALIGRGLSLFPAIGGLRVEMVDEGPVEGQQDIGGLADYDPSSKEAVIKINRNAPDLLTLLAHERAHNLDVMAPHNLLMHANAPQKVLKAIAARYEAQLAWMTNPHVNGGAPTNPLTLRDELYPIVEGDKSKISQYSQEDLKRLTQKAFNRMLDLQTEPFADTLAAVALADNRGHSQWEVTRFKNYLDAVKSLEV